MNRETIDFGIDLGTTNSSIAMWTNNGQVEVLKNNQGSQSTPSAVYEGKRGRLLVGIEAKEQMKVDPDNVQTEFKQAMGTSKLYTFKTSGNSMKPEELSAEILKTLKADVQRRLNEDLKAAVITIPAAFEKSEIYATNKAADKAGFIVSPLCLEPVAAALAYGHQNASKDGFWFVFDFGGGTFDAAIIQLKDEEFQVVNHQGDNNLGGKLIDWAILDNLLIPAVQKEFNRTDFNRQTKDPIIRTAISKLKLATEKAKIELSTSDNALVIVDDFIIAPNGEPLDFEFELNRADVNRMTEPYIIRAINLSLKALKEKRLGPKDMERLILVGGPTQMPIFREMLADPNMGLGIPLEYSVDPMTVVAQGAAIFARTQKIGHKINHNAAKGEVSLDLEYEPAGADDQPLVAGRLIPGNAEGPAGFSIEFFKSDWRSGRIKVSPEGKFMTQLVADRGENTYTIEVSDASGTLQKAIPDKICYLRKAMFKEIPLSHNIAVAKADNSVDPLFEKGMPLPLKKMRQYTQTLPVTKADPNSAIRIPLVEGSNERADRNMIIGYLTIKSEEIRRNVPAGSEIEFTLSVDLSNRLTATAYVPILDQEFPWAIDLEKPQVDTNRIKREATAEITLFKSLEEKVNEMGDEKAKVALARIKEEKIVEEVENALALVDKGDDSGGMLLNRLRDLKLGIDEIESALEWPSLVKEAEKNKAEAEKIVTESKYADNADKDTFSKLCKELEHALEIHDTDLLRRASSELNDLLFDIDRKDPGHWVGLFEYLRTLTDKMMEKGLANDLINQGNRAIDNNDLDGLRSSVRQLIRLLPSEEAEKISGLGSTII